VNWLPRGLIVAAIWGIAVFLWGTFGAWTKNQYIQAEKDLAASHAVAIGAWLDEAVAPLERLAVDARIGPAMALPAGVESLPIQRVLYEYSYLARQSEIYVVDLLRKRAGRTAGTTPLTADTIERLSRLPDAPKMVMGMGFRNGQVFLIRKVDVPLPNRVVVMIPISLMTLAASEPPTDLPEAREFALVIPHTTGWALWKDGEQGFTLEPKLNEAMKYGRSSYMTDETVTALAPVPEWDSVRTSVLSANEIGGARLLPQLLVGLWALVMTVVALWSVSQPLRAKVQGGKLGQKLGPALKPLQGLVGKVGQLAQITVEAVAARLGEGGKEAPLVDGPGAFAKDDFLTASEMSRMAPRKPKAPVRPTTFTQPTKVVERRKGDRRKTPRPGAMDRRMQDLPQGVALAAWQKAAGVPKKPEAKPDEPFVPRFDKDDIHAVVEDALKRRRIKLLYQPIYRASDNMPVMHEVYARLLRGDGHVLTPDVFLPSAAQQKLTLQLDLLVLRKVVQEHFTAGAPLTPLALNISSNSLDGLAYLQELASLGPRVLRKISFEVNSQEMIRDPKALRLLKDIQKHGGSISVDYFGGGTAMLDASKAMGFNSVKLNSMKMGTTDTGKKDLIQLCRYAREIGLPAVMEMIGDKAAEVFARKAQVEFMQGYALGKPSENLTIEPLPPNIDSLQNLAGSS